MPKVYSLTKGRILAVLEDLLNPTTPEAFEGLGLALEQLRDPEVPLTSIGLVDSTNIETPGFETDPLVERVNELWFGGSAGGQPGEWDAQPPYGPGNETTGYWADYYGDVDAIVRQTLVSTIEVSLGLEPGGDAASSTRQWEVELFWKAPNPWFEGWVTWRRSRRHPEEGQVTTIIASPSDLRNRFVTVPGAPPFGNPPLVTPTELSADDQGMWLVTQPQHVRRTDDPARDNASLPLLLPGETWEDQGDVTVLALTEDVGGPAPFGRPYEPPDPNP